MNTMFNPVFINLLALGKVKRKMHHPPHYWNAKGVALFEHIIHNALLCYKAF